VAYLVWAGAVLTLAGFTGIIGTIVAVARARRAELDDAALRVRLGHILPWNLGALFLSCLGMVAMVTGVILG
jgi:hypothetical protein